MATLAELTARRDRLAAEVERVDTERGAILTKREWRLHEIEALIAVSECITGRDMDCHEYLFNAALDMMTRAQALIDVAVDEQRKVMAIGVRTAQLVEQLEAARLDIDKFLAQAGDGPDSE